MTKKTLYLVHCIDTEGPLTEGLDATFERIKNTFNIKLKPSKSNLKKIQQKRLNLNGYEEAVYNMVRPDKISYNNNWKQIKKMLDDCCSKNFKKKFKDSYNKPWVYNWFCVDHIDYDYNPRGRILGYHKIFDFYQKYLKKKKIKDDKIFFHYHPHPIKKHAHLEATRWLGSNDKIFQILCRRIIDRQWFPAVSRPGFNVTRPDSHWFMEQFIPFDYASLSYEVSDVEKKQFDFSNGRSGDWRRAPMSWEPYHPSYGDYQSIGNSKRWIARCLYINSRAYEINEKEVERAFKEVKKGKKVILSFSSHDYRDVRLDVKKVYQLLNKVKHKYSDVKIKNCDALEAFRKVIGKRKNKKLKINAKLKKINANTHLLKIYSNVKIFGPQPFFAIKTKKGEYFYDNLDLQKPGREWSYTFDNTTLEKKTIKNIGIAANSNYGDMSVLNINI